MAQWLAAVLFDLDGTLIDSARDLGDAVNHARRQLGFGPLPLEEVRASIGDGVHKLIERTTPPGSDHRAALASFQSYYAEHLLDSTRPYPGIPELLHSLSSARLGLAVCTNKNLAATEAILAGLGLAQRFDAVLGGDSTGAKKPDPSMLVVALSRLGVPAHRAVVVGDSPNDVAAGRALGIPSIGVTYGIGLPRLLARSRPERMVGSVDELRRELVGFVTRLAGSRIA